jgi:hypothetical protein
MNEDGHKYYYWLTCTDEAGKHFLIFGGNTESEARMKGLEELGGINFDFRRLPTRSLPRASTLIHGRRLEKTHSLKKASEKLGHDKSLKRMNVNAISGKQHQAGCNTEEDYLMTIDLLPSLGRAAAFIGIPFLIMIFVLQYKWAKTCNENIRVLVAQKGGGGAWELAPKDGGIVTITNSRDDSVRTWPVNELATIDVLYPGVGFVPAFMQKTIRMAIVNEGDWEPMLNRSPHRERIASPDVVEFMKAIAEQSSPATKAEIMRVVGTLATGPTREMIADPAVLGNLMRSSVMKALATVSNDLLDVLKSVNAKLTNIVGPNPTVVYIGLGVIVIMLAVLIYFVKSSDTSSVMNDLELIKKALGVISK